MPQLFQTCMSNLKFKAKNLKSVKVMEKSTYSVKVVHKYIQMFTLD